MEILINFTDSDVQKVHDVLRSTEGNLHVEKRFQRNVKRIGLEITREIVWKNHIACLLTSQQRSNIDSPIHKFQHSEPYLLPLSVAMEEKNLFGYAENVLKNFGGIRFSNKIAKQVNKNVIYFKNPTEWDKIVSLLSPFVENPKTQIEERNCAQEIAKKFAGFGPKQSRNLLQGLGLTKYEIPIDSRMCKWLKKLGKSDHLGLLSTKALSDNEYYCALLDSIQILCNRAGVLPCIFDAAVFISKED